MLEPPCHNAQLTAKIALGERSGCVTLCGARDDGSEVYLGVVEIPSRGIDAETLSQATRLIREHGYVPTDMWEPITEALVASVTPDTGHGQWSNAVIDWMTQESFETYVEGDV